MILIDSNIPMYLVGAAHPRKTDAQLLLEQSIAGAERMVTDVEVLQEILHRYSSIERVDAIEPAFGVLLEVTDEVLPVHEDDVLRAKEIVLGAHGLSARDALHIAVMEKYGIDRIMSFDTDFDGLDVSYRKMYDAYGRVFQRCGVPTVAALADSGAMGGRATHEFVYLTEYDEETCIL